jgi:hypothetical protein
VWTCWGTNQGTCGGRELLVPFSLPIMLAEDYFNTPPLTREQEVHYINVMQKSLPIVMEMVSVSSHQ